MNKAGFTLEGKEEFLKKINEAVNKRKKEAEKTVVVGYDAPYALMVHEDLEMPHPNGGQAKFLEQPARHYSQEISDEITKAMKAGATIDAALMVGGDMLLEISKTLVPVDTGTLRDSGYVQIVEGY